MAALLDLLQYTRNGCPVDVDQPWLKKETMTAAERGPHTSALASDTIEMRHAEVKGKVKDGFADLIYLDEIEHLLGSPE